MPNWCLNTLTVTGRPGETLRFRLRAVGHSPWLKPEEIAKEKPAPLAFHNLHPVPAALLQSGYNDAACHWERQNWGCKWGACQTEPVEERPQSVVYRFATANDPPIEFIQHVSRQWPRLTFLLEYEEEGAGLLGQIKACNGEVEQRQL